MKNVLHALCVTLSALLVNSCASYVEEIEPSAYGAFLAARYAGLNQDAASAADLYADALDMAPGDSLLTDRAFITAVLAGELDKEDHLAEASYRSGDESRLAGLYFASELIADRQYSEAHEVLQAASDYGPFNAFLSDMFSQWAMMGAGDVDAALERAQNSSGPGFLSPFLTFHRALLFEAAGRSQDADTAYQASLYSSPLRRMVTEEYGRFLERQNRSDDARVLYQAYLSTTPREASIMFALDRVQRGGRAPRRLTIAQSAARAGFGPAARLASQADMELTVLYLRMLQRLDPNYVPTRLLLAGSLERIGLADVALDEYASIRRGPYALAAQIDQIWLTARQERVEQATFMARDLVDRTGSQEARLMLADLLRAQSQCAESEGLYADVIAERDAAGLSDDWRYHYYRASCLFDLGRWEESESEFLAALALAPDEPQILNYLGYVWVDQGLNLERAFSMIERAAELLPQEGYIIDSLGWAHYRLGNYEAATMHLERAAALDPGNATANYHLGDAYWQVGRRLEAGFQWRRTLDLSPTEEELEGLNLRLEHGLPDAVSDEIEIDIVSNRPVENQSGQD